MAEMMAVGKVERWVALKVLKMVRSLVVLMVRALEDEMVGQMVAPKVYQSDKVEVG
jgi:hypothetical protein